MCRPQWLLRLDQMPCWRALQNAGFYKRMQEFKPLTMHKQQCQKDNGVEEEGRCQL